MTLSDPDTQALRTNRSEPPASSVAFLYAHLFAPAAKPGRSGTRSLANEAVVEPLALARMLIAVALWSLHDAGAIGLEPFTEKRLRFIEWSGVRVRPIAPVETSGIEAIVMATINRSGTDQAHGSDVSLLAKALVDTSKNGAQAVISKAIDDVVALGYADRVTTEAGIMERRLRGKPRTRLEGRQTEIESLRPEVDSLRDRWNAFYGEQPKLRAELLAAVRKALDQLKARDSDD